MIKVAIFYLVAIMFLGCAKLTTTYSTFQIETSNLEKVEAIVHSSFMELGFHGGRYKINKKEQNVYSVAGQPYLFEVTYKITNEKVIIQITSNDMNRGYLASVPIDEYFSKITNLISKKLQDANLKATVETKSYWVPSLL